MRLAHLRAAGAILGLSIVAGALAGLCVSFLLDASAGGLFNSTLDGAIYGFGAVVGAVLGALLGPIAAFGFLRRVPLGRLFLQTLLGAALGGLVGLRYAIAFPAQGVDFAAVIGGGVVGFLLAAALLWRRYRDAPMQRVSRPLTRES